MPISRQVEPQGVTAVAALRQSNVGGSGSFLILADDGRRYWCKTLNNFQSPRVPANEQIVARLGQLIGAPVCEPQVVRIPSALVGWEFRPGRALEEGWAHGSLAADPATETRTLNSRSTDDNPRRHAGVYAIHDWLGGSDSQWLMVGSDAAYYSHDHGHYFPGGPEWTVTSLEQNETTAFPLGVPPAGLDSDELSRLADRLEELSEEEIAGAVSKLPAGWPVTDTELEAVATFADRRRLPVADRLRGLIGAV